MIVHLGIIVLAVAFAAQTSYQRVGEFRLAPGDSASFGGHTFTLVDQVLEDTPAAAIQKARIQIDGGRVYAPALQLYKARGDNVATPSVRTGLTQDIYLTLLKPSSAADDHVTFGVRLMPMTLWLWVGGLLVAVGTVLAAFPGRRRRRPTDPVSAPIRVDAASAPATDADAPDLIGVPRAGRRLGAADV